MVVGDNVTILPCPSVVRVQSSCKDGFKRGSHWWEVDLHVTERRSRKTKWVLNHKFCTNGSPDLDLAFDWIHWHCQQQDHLWHVNRKRWGVCELRFFEQFSMRMVFQQELQLCRVWFCVVPSVTVIMIPRTRLSTAGFPHLFCLQSIYMKWPSPSSPTKTLPRLIQVKSENISFHKTIDLCFLFRAAVFVHLKSLLAAILSCV